MERERYGLAKLILDPILQKQSRSHCIWMANHYSMQHSTHGVAENIAMGYTTIGGVVRGWMNSSGHRNNILNSRHTKIGVAGYISDNGVCYWCQQFSP